MRVIQSKNEQCPGLSALCIGAALAIAFSSTSPLTGQSTDSMEGLSVTIISPVNESPKRLQELMNVLENHSIEDTRNFTGDGIKFKVLVHAPQVCDEEIVDALVEAIKEAGVKNVSKLPPAIQWHVANVEKLKELRKMKRVLAFFSAEWCATCEIMKHKLFFDQETLELARDYQLEFVRVDMTETDNAIANDLAQEYGIKIVPTLLLFDPADEKPVSRGGFVRPQELENILKSTFKQK